MSESSAQGKPEDVGANGAPINQESATVETPDPLSEVPRFLKPNVEESVTSPVSEASGKKRSPFVKFLLGSLYCLFLFAALAIGSAMGYIRTSPIMSQIVMQALDRTPPDQVFNKDTLTVLILGCDEDLTIGGANIIHQQARSDMLLLLKCDFKNRSIVGLSIPRDTYYKLEGYPGHKINAFHAIGGNELSQAAIEDMLGVKIDKTISLDFESFKQMVDLVGGVHINVPRKMDYDDNAGHLHIHLVPGPQVLNGEQAMGFVRFRHADSDFARQQRQREFVLALKAEVMKKPGLFDAVARKAIEVLNNELTPRECASLALFSKSLPPTSIQMTGLPVREKEGTTALFLDKPRAKAVLKKLGMLKAEDSQGKDEEEGKPSN
ncbi:MAG: LCP family protein [Armatimonadetes bacterium]|nr:LCP family protein [Armatimonadota bacterium]